jgi:hypothetical protein
MMDGGIVALRRVPDKRSINRTFEVALYLFGDATRHELAARRGSTVWPFDVKPFAA